MQSRIRWTPNEFESVVKRCVELRSQHPSWTGKKLVEKAQDVLSAARRRPVHPPLLSRVNKALADSDHGEPVPVGDDRRVAPADNSAAVSLPRAEQGALVSGAMTVDSLVSYGIEAVSALLVGVLRQPAVKESLANLIEEILREASPAASSTGSVSLEQQSSSPVLVIGLSDKQALEIERAYRGVIELKFDPGNVMSPALRDAVLVCDVGIVMDGTVSPDVARYLRQSMRRVLRNGGGLSGLRQELAELALPLAGHGKSPGSSLSRSGRRT